MDSPPKQEVIFLAFECDIHHIDEGRSKIKKASLIKTLPFKGETLIGFFFLNFHFVHEPASPTNPEPKMRLEFLFEIFDQGQLGQ